MSSEGDGDCDMTSALGPASSLKNALAEDRLACRQVPSLETALTCFVKPLLGFAMYVPLSPIYRHTWEYPAWAEILDRTRREIGGDYHTEGKKIQQDTWKLSLSEAGGEHSVQLLPKSQRPSKSQDLPKAILQSQDRN